MCLCVQVQECVYRQHLSDKMAKLFPSNIFTTSANNRWVNKQHSKYARIFSFPIFSALFSLWHNKHDGFSAIAQIFLRITKRRKWKREWVKKEREKNIRYIFVTGWHNMSKTPWINCDENCEGKTTKRKRGDAPMLFLPVEWS